MAKVAIGAGHGMHTPGKRSPADEREWSFNNIVVTEAIRYLKGYGINVLRMDDPTGKTDVPLTTRTNKANSWGADILISYHHNAIKGIWGNWSGVETFYYPGASTGLKLAKAIHPSIVDAMGLPNRGIKTANFHMVRESHMPAILIEGGFMDSKIDIVKMRDDKVLKRAGKALADAIAAYFGIKGESKPSKPSSKPSPSPSKSISEMAKEVIDGKHGEGHANRRKSLGVSQSVYNKVRAEVNRRLGAGSSNNSKPSKSISEMAKEVIDGKHGSGHANRRRSLGISSTEYDKVREEVNRRLGVGSTSSSSKSISQMAKEVIDGKHGNGHENRRKSLGISQAEYKKVSKEVNRRLGSKGSVPSKSISQMANEVIAGKHGSGHANRRKSLGVSQSVYNKVRAEVNRRL